MTGCYLKNRKKNVEQNEFHEIEKRLKFNVVPSVFQEDLDKSKFPSPYDYCLETATEKAKEVYKRLEKEGNTPNIVISADSIVVLGDKILEKPKDVATAKEMLKEMSGKSHNVCTAVHLICNNNGSVSSKSFYEITTVEFDNLSSSLIDYYVDNFKPLDKAGSYGIQELAAASFIKSINGDFYNVTGIPIHALSKQLRSLSGFFKI
eukprot:gene2730-3388_t